MKIDNFLDNFLYFIFISQGLPTPKEFSLFFSLTQIVVLYFLYNKKHLLSYKSTQFGNLTQRAAYFGGKNRT